MSEPVIYTDLQVLQFDPTRTTSLRKLFVRSMNQKFRQLLSVIWEAIVTDDGFGLNLKTNVELPSPGYQAFNFPRSSQKVEAFMQWLRRQEDLGLLKTVQLQSIGASVESGWTDLFIADSYKRGVIRARHELRKAKYEVPSIEESGGIDVIMGAPFHIDRVGLAFTRTFEGLKGITAAMDTQISQVLAMGLVDGDNPRLIARKLVAVINGGKVGELGITDTLGRFIPARQRAEMLARTEIIRAHHMANIQEYKNWKALGITVIAEWGTAGDDRVCDECAGLHGNQYTLKEIEHMIPRHPNCRCIAIPIAHKTKK